MLDKQQLRQNYRLLRDQHSVVERRGLSERIWHRCVGLESVVNAERVASYAAIGSEVWTEGLHALLRQAGKRVLYPRVRGKGSPLSFEEVARYGDMQPGTMGILEPRRGDVSAPPPEVVLVPGLAFDKEGARLGYGGGYYDRTLDSFDGTAVGLAFAFQVVDSLPVLEHDRRVDILVTEFDAMVCRSSVEDGASPCPK